LNINSVIKFVTGIVQLRGATDNTRIGNISDNLKAQTPSEGQHNSAVPSYATIIGADDGTNTRRLQGRIAAPLLSDYGLVVRSIPFQFKTFCVSSQGVTNAANKSMISITNTGSSVCRIHEIWLWNIQTTSVTGTMSMFELRRIASHSVGTSLTPAAHDTSDTLGGGITVRTGATVVTEGGILYRKQWSNDEHGVGTLDQEGNDKNFQQSIPFYICSDLLNPLTIRQNQGLHIKQTVGAVGSFDFLIFFSEADV
jgi:hypothetical protein